MKKLLCLLETMMLLIMPVVANAESLENEMHPRYKLVWENGREYILDQHSGDMLTQFADSSGNVIPIELVLDWMNEESKQEMLVNDANGLNAVVDPNDITFTSINQNYKGEALKMTPDCEGGGTIEVTQSQTVTHTVSGSVGATVDAFVIAKIHSEITAACAYSLSTGFSYARLVPAGKTGSIWFQPYYIYTAGTWQGKSFANKYPKKTDSGLADGYWYLVVR